MTRLLNNNGKKYTPTDATYEPATGQTVITIGSHDFEIGDSIYIEPDSLTFTCALDGDLTEHSYPTTEFINYTPTLASYDPATGEFWAQIGVNALKVGDLVEFKPGSIVFTCAKDDNVTNHPAPESHHPFYKKQIVIDRIEGGTVIHMNVGAVAQGGGLHTFVSAETNAIQAEKSNPAYKQPVIITDRDATTITVSVGVSSDTSVHTFVSATTNAIREADMWTGTFTPQTATYDPISGDMEITIGNHDLPVGKWIEIAPESMVFSCDVGGVTGTDAAPLYDHPAYKEPVRVKAVTGNTITVNVTTTPIVNYDVSNATYDAGTGHLVLDIGTVGVAALKGPTAGLTATGASYDPSTGVMTLTVTGHNMANGDRVNIADNSLTFTCTQGSGNHSYPRSSDPASGNWLDISNVTTNTFDVQVLENIPSTNTTTHTFVSATTGWNY